jgi:hypothetical protein
VKRVVVSLGLAAALAAAVALAIRDQARVRCEVCMVYGGQQVCEAARSGDRNQALMQAAGAACARLARGVTDSIRCNNTPPVAVECSE